MDQTFHNFIQHLPACPTRSAIERLLQQTIQSYGLDYFAYVGYPSVEQIDKPRALTNYPSSWVDHYAKNRYDLIDPVIGQAVNTVLPFDWTLESLADSLTRPQRTFLEEAAQAGIHRGVTIPIQDRHGKAASLTLAARGATSDFLPRIEMHQHELHLIAIHLHARLGRKVEPRTRPLLTPREIECLQWATKGKSALDTARIMQISRRTVVFHIENAKQKFGVATLPQAIAQGLTYSIITA